MAASPSWRSWRWIDGGIRPFRGGLPLSDRGFRYGQHLFESIAVRGGAALLAAEHLAILTASAKTYGIPFPGSLAAKLRDFLKTVSPADGMLRIYLTAGPGAPASPITKPGLYLTWEPAHFPTKRETEKGYDGVLLMKPFPGEGWGVKSGNYSSHVEALRSAREAGGQEGVVRDPKGRIISCTMGNLLLKIGKQAVALHPLPRRGSAIRSCPEMGAASYPRCGERAARCRSPAGIGSCHHQFPSRHHAGDNTGWSPTFRSSPGPYPRGKLFA